MVNQVISSRRDLSIDFPVGGNLHTPKQTWNLKMDPWKRRFLLETIISRFHVNFWGCNLSKRSLNYPKNYRVLKGGVSKGRE